ncbi:glycerophosphodiester phosphodiesterase family protein [Xanthomonas sp. PPL568]|uniref:glycerophosphodiester phosphodiesterase family protein n=1 Tax=Xanthomonas indica TaxID=2912242 RepID=UPI001F561B60|nr:glycerophosphodiester phosphodiesterase family protein [Xanthomonas indica]MCI2244667.1 glycerophosphodiester phosphodiesterase family protein [Xanthomonas indica]
MSAVLSLPILAMAATPSLPDRLRDPHGPALVVSHRACWKFASENTLDGIAACIARGVDMVEIDVRTTRDGALVLMHDATVDRTTDGHGAVADLTAAQIAALRVRSQGGGRDSTLTARHPPTLAQALALARGKVLVNLDIKAAALDQVIDTVEAAGAQRDVLLNVPLDVPAAVLQRARKADIAVQALYLQRESTLPPEQALRRAAGLQPAVVQLMFDDPVVLDIAQRELAPHTRLFVNTMTNDIASGKPMRLSAHYTDQRALRDPAAVWGGLRKHGVSMIQTDEPLALQRYLHGTDTPR